MNPQKQRMDALAKANEVRYRRADMLNGLRSGTMAIDDFDLDEPSIQSMAVIDLLRDLRWNAVPVTAKRVRRGNAQRGPLLLIREMGLRETTQLKALSPGRKHDLKLLIKERVPSQREENRGI